MKLARLLSLLPFFLVGCFGSGNEQQSGGLNASVFYFASNRTAPNNSLGDGDIFFISAFGIPGENTLTNLTGNGSEIGDSDDHLCLLDFVRGRAFFMSQRTDIGNPTGDLDIFVVPLLGGPIVNLTDEQGTPGDDFCNDIHAATGDLIFTSNREDAGQTDFDIYRLTLGLDETGNVATQNIQNLTNLPDDGSGPSENFIEGFEILIDDTLIFSSQRVNEDQDGVANCNADLHLFAIDLSQETPAFRNLTQSGDDNLCLPGLPSITIDHLCGVVRSLDANGAPSLERLMFTSNQNLGTNNGAQFYLDHDVFTMTPQEPGVIYNLTDASSGDADDVCERLVEHSFGNENAIADQFVAVFQSQRSAAGTVNANGIWSETVNADFDQDLFMTDLPVTAQSNHVTVLTDRVSQNSGGVDKPDTFVGLCGTTVIFESDRNDIQDNPGLDRDLYAIDLAGGIPSKMIPLSNNADATSGQDQVDCFLGCDATLASAYFVSLRDDHGNHGPVPDSDLFRVRFRDSAFSLKNASDLVIENLTDVSAGDHYDFADPAFFSGGFCGTGSLESDVDEFSSGNALGPYLRPLFEDDFGFGINASNTLLFTSLRTDPVNELGEADIFSMDLPFTPDTPMVPLIVNRTNLADENSASDASDGLEGYLLPISGPLH